MTKFYNQNVLDKGLEYIVNNANEMRVLSAYTQGDSYATIVANTICLIHISPTDLTLGNQGFWGQEMVFIAEKSGTATASTGTSPKIHVALSCSTGTEVIAVTEVTTNQQVFSGNPIRVPEFWMRRIKS